MKEIDEPGVNFIYQSGVTQLLGFIVEKATGEKLSDYVSRKLWTPMHAEESAFGASTGRTAWKKPIAVSTVTPVISPASDNYYSTTVNGMASN